MWARMEKRGKEMKTTSILILALALCLCFVLPVAAVGTYYENKYVERNAFDSQQPIDKVTGTLKGSVRSGFNVFTNEIGVRNDVNPDGVNGTFEFYPINPDGTFEISLIPGSFTLYVKDGNGGQPEYSHATIIANSVSNPERDIIGHAASGADATCVPFYTIIDAKYGIAHTTCNDITEYRTRGHWDSYQQYVCDNWQGWRCKGGHWETRYSWDHSNSWSSWSTVMPSMYSDIHNCDKQSREREVCVVDGQVIDVTSNVQNAVAQGATSFMFFDNAQNPGGIFRLAGNLLSQINDPAPGIVKNVYIEYSNGCGSDRTIKAMEYDHINLVTGAVTPESTS